MAEKKIISQLQFKRGLESELSEFLNVGEFGFATDTGKLYIGGSLAEQVITQRAYTDALEARTLENFESVIKSLNILESEKVGRNDVLDGGKFIQTDIEGGE